MGGYKFLMRYYIPGDDIYFFGFSRGAYVARFLAEMLDYIGLLEAGNEELIRFAWKTFAKWQQRRGQTEEDQEAKKKLFNYMKAFRETFSRPISRIRFMGLFDTVNSVPRFESAWMQRSKFPYTARSSAKVIRHAVGIDERRAKFRQDLISEAKPWHKSAKPENYLRRHLHHSQNEKPEDIPNEDVPKITLNTDGEDGNLADENTTLPMRGREETESVYRTPRSSSAGSPHNEHRYRAPSPSPNNAWRRNLSLAVPMRTASTEDLASIHSDVSATSLQVPQDVSQEDESRQDIQEIWFPGGHADIGGGWKLGEGEVWPLSHAPLVWMVQEAQKAGLDFDYRKMKQFECLEDYAGQYSPIREFKAPVWTACDDSENHGESQSGPKGITFKGSDNDARQRNISAFRFRKALELSSTTGVLHDCLRYGEGLGWPSVLTWRIMEYLPFRRMDLQPDGSWKPIRWPLPCGEVRDIPNDARIHVSAIRRLKHDANYRPGNLIVGGGGRGMKRAPPKYGIGEWVLYRDEGDPVRETYIRKSEAKKATDARITQ